MDYVKTVWSGTASICPKCSAYNSYTVKWHNKCRKMGIEHMHVKCHHCNYEWGTSGKDANI